MLTEEIISLQDKAIANINVVLSENSNALGLQTYQEGNNKIEVFEELTHTIDTILAQQSTQNPVQRRLIDEYQGLLNRRKILLDTFHEYKKTREQTHSGIRGKIATLFIE